jgi:O-antigen/teichoic acid export membrane protein
VEPAPRTADPDSNDVTVAPVWGGLPVLKRGAIESLVVRGIGAVAAFAAHWVLARVLPVGDYGAYLHVLAWIGLLALPCTLGYHLATVRLAAAYDAERRDELLRGVLRHAGWTTLLVSCAVAVVAALIAWFADLGPQYTAAAVGAGAAILPLASLTAVAAGVARGLRRIAAARAPSAVLRPLLIGGVVYALSRGVPSLTTETALLVALGGYGAAALVSWGVATSALRRAAGPGPARVRRRAWRLVALPLLGFTALEMLLNGMNVPLIALVLGEEPTAVYGVAQRISSVLVFLLLASNAILGPVIAGAHARGELLARRDVIRTLVRVVFALTALGGATVWILAEPLLAIFGDDYVVGSTALRLLVVYGVVSAAFGPQGLLLAMTDRTRELMWVMAATTALHLLALLVVLPTYGIVGAAAVACASAVLQNVPLLVISQKRLGMRVSIV